MNPSSPGWYPDPRREAVERWWDGNQWTEQARNLTNADLSEISDVASNGAGVIWSVATGVFGTFAVKFLFSAPLRKCGSSLDDYWSDQAFGNDIANPLTATTQCNIFGSPVVPLDDFQAMGIALFVGFALGGLVFLIWLSMRN